MRNCVPNWFSGARKIVTTSLLGIVMCNMTVQADEPIVLDSTRQLFLDDYLIAWGSNNLTRQIHPVRKHPANPVLNPSEPWEGKGVILYGSVIQDGDKYRMWYKAGKNICYAESRNGVSWTKPKLNVIKMDGQKTNIVVKKGVTEGLEHYYELFGVHKDPRESDPSRRYKMGFLNIHPDYTGPREDPFHKGQRRGLGVLGSSDGIDWKLIDNWTTEAICDGATHWMFDPARNKYVLYGRTNFISPDVAEAGADVEWFKYRHWGRAVARVESSDFVNWDITEPAQAPVVMAADIKDPIYTEIYSMMVFPYEGVYIGLVQMFNGHPDYYLDIQLAVSRDSINFTRVGDRTPSIPVGSIGTWDRFNQSLANNPPILAGDELRFYYGGRAYRHSPYQGTDEGTHSSGVGLATIPRDRFVSLGTSYDDGRIFTKPMTLAGKKLHINAKSDFGKVVITVIQSWPDKVAKSKPISGDSLDTVVEWEEGGLDEVTGPVRLRIELENALLFSIWCD